MMIAFTAGFVAFWVVGILAFLVTLAPSIESKKIRVTVLEVASGKEWEFDTTRRGNDWTYGGFISYPIFSTGLQIGFRDGPVVIVGSYQITEADRSN